MDEIRLAWLLRDSRGGSLGGLEGASAIKSFGDLTGKQPYELMHTDHNQVKIKLVLTKLSLNGYKIKKRKFE